MPFKQDRAGKEMAISTVSSMRQLAWRLCFIPNARKPLQSDKHNYRLAKRCFLIYSHLRARVMY